MSALLKSSVLESPDAAEVDAQAVEYKRLEKILDDAKAVFTEVKKKQGADLDKLHVELIELVRAFGGKHHEKSKILHGVDWELMATFGQSAGIDSTAVERLRLALKEAGETRLLKKLFSEEKSYRLAPNAAEILKGDKLPDKLAILALACFTFTPVDATARSPTEEESGILSVFACFNSPELKNELSQSLFY